MLFCEHLRYMDKSGGFKQDKTKEYKKTERFYAKAQEHSVIKRLAQATKVEVYLFGDDFRIVELHNLHHVSIRIRNLA